MIAQGHILGLVFGAMAIMVLMIVFLIVCLLLAIKGLCLALVSALRQLVRARMIGAGKGAKPKLRRRHGEQRA